jgi:amidohydrolase
MNIEGLQKLLFDYFTWFHRHPELSFAEAETTRRIRTILEEWGFEILPSSLKTGLVSRLMPSKPDGKGRIVALRADIDALPVQEQTNLDYASQNPGIMHACGHDFHIAALLGAARLLWETRDDLEGSVKLIFQPAEEIARGAKAVLETGLLDDVDLIYGLHVHPGLETGTVAVSEEPAYAGVGLLKIIVQGRGGHAGIPQLAIDPVVVCAQLIQSAQTVISRNIDPFAPAVVSITHVEAGNAWNVIPESAFLEGTIRVMSNEQWEIITSRLSEICQGIALVSGAEIRIEIEKLTPPTNNHPVITRLVRETAEDLGLSVKSSIPKMTGEDFALYQEKIPGVFLEYGVNSPCGLHHPGFSADPQGLAQGAILLYEIVKKTFLKKKPRHQSERRITNF